MALLAIVGLMALGTSAASAQAQAPGCPPGVPFGRDAGQPPNTPGPQTGRPSNYPPGRCSLALSRNAGQRGDTFTANGNGFVPGETVTLSVAGVRAASAVVAADGTFTQQVTVPASAPIGATEVLAAGQSQQLSASFEVLAAGAPRGVGSGTLPRTGTELLGIGLAGAGLVAAGSAAVVMARRRRTATA